MGRTRGGRVSCFSSSSICHFLRRLWELSPLGLWERKTRAPPSAMLVLTLTALALASWFPAPRGLPAARAPSRVAMQAAAPAEPVGDEPRPALSVGAPSEPAAPVPSTDAGACPVAATLELLEWPRLSAHVATFASTAHGREVLAEGLEIPARREASEALLLQTEEAFTVESVLARPLELRGFGHIEPLVSLASKGGVLTGEQLATVATSLGAAGTLVKALKAAQAAAAGEGTGAHAGGSGVRVLPALFDGVPVQAGLRRSIGEAVDDSGVVRDTAEPALGELRYAMREVAAAARREMGRLVTEKASALATRNVCMRDDRFVLQVLAKQKHRVPGTVRDVSASGATLFVEPRALEPTNTKLRQLAKREAALVQTVLRRLSAALAEPKLAAELVQLQRAVTTVDLAAARARYGARLRARPARFVDVEESGVRLPGLQHPLLVWPVVGSAPNASLMVPMDIEVRSEATARASHTAHGASLLGELSRALLALDRGAPPPAHGRLWYPRHAPAARSEPQDLSCSLA